MTLSSEFLCQNPESFSVTKYFVNLFFTAHSCRSSVLLDHRRFCENIIVQFSIQFLLILLYIFIIVIIIQTREIGEIPEPLVLEFLYS